MKKKSTSDIQNLMKVSENIGELNHERYRNFEKEFTRENFKAGAFDFNGDVYRNMDIEHYSLKDFEICPRTS
ncbi:peroxide stress protein YaaA [Echinicola jeungdonensis]|uniref:peroxide stress protein YaaA n=1 Tax=Echinicola jeungdonensis TaxID=709343 RepID=UPI0025B5B0BB|nr:peroxide stress protein YaaA [Echinicola jeungdonensis]MDN3671385.1 peroxide stress protein YaaA [Echinicola jeungdonensis]